MDWTFANVKVEEENEENKNQEGEGDEEVDLLENELNRTCKVSHVFIATFILVAVIFFVIFTTYRRPSEWKTKGMQIVGMLFRIFILLLFLCTVIFVIKWRCTLDNKKLLPEEDYLMKKV